VKVTCGASYRQKENICYKMVYLIGKVFTDKDFSEKDLPLKGWKISTG